MKNITLSIPDHLLNKSRKYAKSHGTTVNSMVREFLKKTVSSEDDNLTEKIHQSLDEMGVDTTLSKFNREELYERQGLS